MQIALVSEKTKHYTLLLAFDFIAHQVPDILIECLVLGLPNEANLVWWQMIWIHHTVASGCAYLGEQVTPCSFWCRNGSGAVAMYGCVLAVWAFAVIVASTILFRNFARKVMDWIFVNNLCHMCSAIEPNRPPRRAVRPLAAPQKVWWTFSGTPQLLDRFTVGTLALLAVRFLGLSVLVFPLCRERG